ncbi:MAG: hypothetical protein AABX49_00110, partial [Nanoarchaeota archaeon]
VNSVNPTFSLMSFAVIFRFRAQNKNPIGLVYFFLPFFTIIFIKTYFLRVLGREKDNEVSRSK